MVAAHQRITVAARSYTVTRGRCRNTKIKHEEKMGVGGQFYKEVVGGGGVYIGHFTQFTV